MRRDLHYVNRIDVMNDFLFDANRGLPVEIICKAKNAKSYLNHILAFSDAELYILDLNFDDIDGINKEDEVMIDISDNKISLCPLIMYSSEKGRVKLFSGDGYIKYVSDDCDEYFLNEEDNFCVFKFSIGG